MLNLPSHTSIYLCAAPVDLRKSFDGLGGLVASVFGRSLLDGQLFLFVNKRRDRLKALWWDRDGLVIWYKKFESHYPHFFLFTGISEAANNRVCWPSSAS